MSFFHTPFFSYFLNILLKAGIIAFNKIPVIVPIIIPEIIRIGTYEKIYLLFVIIPRAVICPILWKTAPNILKVI